MKVIIAYTSKFPPNGGFSASDRRVRDIARGQILAGNYVSVAIPRWHATTKELCGQFEPEVVYLGTVFDKIPLLNRVFFWQRLVWFSYKQGCRSVILYSPTIDSIIAILGFRLLGIKSYLEISDLLSHNRPFSLAGFIHRLGELILPAMVNTVLPISNVISSKIRSICPWIVPTVVPILVDTDVFVTSSDTSSKFRKSLGIESNKLVICYSGGMYVSYGVDKLILGFKIFCRKFPNRGVLVIAGKCEQSPTSTNAEKLVKEHGLESSVFLTGWVDTTKVVEILNAADILVIPHEKTISNTAGLPTKLAEYAAVGKAIIATDVGDISSYFKHNEDIFVIRSSSPELFADALETVSSSPEFIRVLGANAKRVASNNFCYKRVGAQLAELLRK